MFVKISLVAIALLSMVQTVSAQSKVVTGKELIQTEDFPVLCIVKFNREKPTSLEVTIPVVHYKMRAVDYEVELPVGTKPPTDPLLKARYVVANDPNSKPKMKQITRTIKKS